MKKTLVILNIHRIGYKMVVTMRLKATLRKKEKKRKGQGPAPSNEHLLGQLAQPPQDWGGG